MDTEHNGDTEQRKRIMSTKGLEAFLATSDKHNRTLSRISREIDEHCLILTSGEYDNETLTLTLDLLHKCLENYVHKSDEFSGLLLRSRTADAERELAAHRMIRDSLVRKVEELLKTFTSKSLGTKLKLQVQSKAPSVISNRDPSRRTLSKGSSINSSTRSSLILRQKAKAEAAKKRLEFLKEESDLIIQKAQIDAREKNLSARKEAAIAVAELHAMEEASEVEHSSVESEVKYNFTEEFVSNQNDILCQDRGHEQYILQPSQHINQIHGNVTSQEQPQLRSEIVNIPSVSRNTINREPVVSVTAYINDKNNNVDFAKYLVKKDLLTSRLCKFDDRPENYVSWKDSFKNIMNEISASASEELDLLLQYTGLESNKQVKSIKVSNAGNPSTALERAWDRLNTRYGSPERVECALKKKLAAVQKISYKDKGKLFELSDILSEIRAVKEKVEYSALLSVYEKRKWNVLFPPFTYFCDFILEMAEVVNDPCFDFEVQGQSNEPRRNTRNVIVMKTEVEKDNNNLRCIIHNANHTLNECRVFRHKTLGERKGLLKQHGVCFRCCQSKHLRKDCQAKIKCGECKESSHATAMHVHVQTRRENQTKELDREGLSFQGEEKERVLAKCTDICDGGTGKSCAKIVLVDIYHKQRTQSEMRIYAIIDEQSNSSLVHSEILDYFNVKSELKQYLLSTCSGEVAMTGRRASGFIVKSLSGNTMELPTLIECDMIPNNRNEIPTPDVAEKYFNFLTYRITSRL